jgi:hypothetical protein
MENPEISSVCRPCLVIEFPYLSSISGLEKTGTPIEDCADGKLDVRRMVCGWDTARIFTYRKLACHD